MAGGRLQRSSGAVRLDGVAPAGRALRAAPLGAGGASLSPAVPVAGAIVVVGLVALAVGLHLAAGFGFPRPWPDESHFLAPALQLGRHGTLAVPQLNAPRGIFWMPDGYSVLLAPLLALPLAPLDAARWVSLGGVVAFALGLAAAGRCAGLPWLVAALPPAAWLCFPRVVMAANIARMEGVVLGLAGAVLVLVGRRRWAAALAVSVLAVLVHPVGVALPAAVTGTALARRGRLTRPRRWEWVVVALVVAAAGVEVARFLAAADLAAAHLGFQVARKAGRGLDVVAQQWLGLAAGTVGLIAVSAAGRRGRPREEAAPPAALLLCTLLAVLFAGIDVVGREQWYEVLGRETAVVLGAVAALAASGRAAAFGPDRAVPAPRRRSTAAGVVLAGGAGLAVVPRGGGLTVTLTRPQFGMRLADGDRAEWRAFSADAVSALERLDRAPGAPALVVVDPLSGFGQELFDRRWRRLRVVQPTPATPLDADRRLSRADAWARRSRPGLAEQWGTRPDAAAVASAEGTYSLVVVEAPDAP